MFEDQYWNSASSLLYVGNLAVQQAVTNGNTTSGFTDGNCNNSAHYYFQFYHTFGDGSVMPYITKPEVNTVTIPSTVTPGTTSITINALAGSYVAVTDNSSVIYGVAEANASGVATVTFTNAIPSSGTLYVVVTRQQYQPYFGTISVVGGTQYTISATASPSNGGTVSGAGQYYENTQCTLTATPNTGYTFTNWKKGNNVVSTNANYTFTVTSSTSGSYTATFTAIPQYTITASANPTAGGTVSGGGTFYSGSSCTLTATANTGYAFTNWTKNGSQVSTNPTYTFTVTAAGSYVANFDQLTAHSVSCGAVENGSISASVATAYPGDVVTLTATANSGYFFSEWDVRDANNNTVSVTNNQFTMPNSDVTVSAAFVSGSTVTIAEVEHGTVTASATEAVPGTTITLTAAPESGCYLSSWLVFKTGDVRNTVAVTGNSFVLPAYDVTVVGIFKMTMEAEVAIGSGTSADSYLPTYAYYKYSLTQQIYTAAEVGQAGTITKIAFKVSNSKATSRTLDIYLKHTTKTAFTSQTGWETVSSGDKVFSGSVAFQSSGWTTITLTTPFEYDGTSNLVVCVDDNTGTYVSSSNNSPKFYVYSTGANRALRIYSDGTNYTATSPGSYSGTYVTSNNQITFTMNVGGNSASLAVSPNVLDGFTYVQGEGPSAAKSLAVVGVDLTEGITVTAPADFEISDEENGSYSSTLTLTADRSRSATTYDFEDGAQGWTFLKGSAGDSPNNWMHCTDYTPRDYTSGYGHSSSNGFMLSESYISGTESGTGTGVHPDNYLVSPEVTLGGSITFWASNPNDDYGSEHFALLVSTTGNTSVGSFTQVQEWTLLAKGTGNTRTIVDGIWYEYSADLSAFSGTGYVAIRHFDCYDQWLLCVDDISIEEEDGPVTPTDPTVDLLTANVYVRLKGGLSQGSYAGETLSVTTGGATGNVSLSGTVTQPEQTEQTVALNGNWSWWSTNLDITLDQLKNAIAAAVGTNGTASIKSQEGAITYRNGQWRGTAIQTLDIRRMYELQTSVSCEITLTGAEVNPSDYEITIHNGSNWIGYLCGEDKTLNEAFGTFPVDGDVVKSRDNSSVYRNGQWRGQLSGLEPGKGYIYESSASGNRTFTFPSSAK